VYFTSQNIAKNFGMGISPVKAETIGSLGQDPGRCKIIGYNKFLQQVKIFKYLSGEIF
jgi:hypothetical protein